MSYFKSGSDRVEDYEFKDVLAVLEGPSRWQTYICTNLAKARSKISSGTFQIVPSEKFDDVLQSLDISDPNAVGVTNKQNGQITMKEWGPNSHQSYLLASLHECVHLVSHPPEQGKRHSTAYGYLGAGLLEGLVECVAEDILSAQKISLPSASSGMLGYSDGRTDIAREFVKNWSVPFFARVLFEGSGDQLTAMMNYYYSIVGWVQIKNLISNGKINDARNEMARLFAEEEKKRNAATRAVQQRLHNVMRSLP